MIMFLKYTRFQFPLLDPSWNQISRYATEKNEQAVCVCVAWERIIFGLDERETRWETGRERKKGKKGNEMHPVRVEIPINESRSHSGGNKFVNVKTSVCNWLPL